MLSVNYPRNLAASFLVALVIAVYGSLLAIDGMAEWYPSLVKPIDIPMWLFAIIQPLYYAICISVVYRLVSYIDHPKTRRLSLFLVIFMMLFAETWNYLFLGLRNVSLGFWAMLAFSGVAIAVFINLRRVDPVSSRIFLPYLIWLLADISWMYGIWVENS